MQQALNKSRKLTRLWSATPYFVHNLKLFGLCNHVYCRQPRTIYTCATPYFVHNLNLFGLCNHVYCRQTWTIYTCIHTYIHAYIHTYIHICCCNFDALAQASDIRIERRQVVFLCWRQDSNPEGLRHLFASRLNACWQTDWAIEDQA